MGDFYFYQSHFQVRDLYFYSIIACQYFIHHCWHLRKKNKNSEYPLAKSLILHTEACDVVNQQLKQDFVDLLCQISRWCGVCPKT